MPDPNLSLNQRPSVYLDRIFVVLRHLENYHLTPTALDTTLWIFTKDQNENAHTLHALDCRHACSRRGSLRGVLTDLDPQPRRALTRYGACEATIRPLCDELDVLEKLATTLKLLGVKSSQLAEDLGQGFYRMATSKSPKTFSGYSHTWHRHYALAVLCDRAERTLDRSCATTTDSHDHDHDRWTQSVARMTETAHMRRTELARAADVDDCERTLEPPRVYLARFDDETGSTTPADVLRALRHAIPAGTLTGGPGTRAQPVYVLRVPVGDHFGRYLLPLGEGPFDRTQLQLRVTQSLIDSTAVVLTDPAAVWATAAGILA